MMMSSAKLLLLFSVANFDDDDKTNRARRKLSRLLLQMKTHTARDDTNNVQFTYMYIVYTYNFVRDETQSEEKTTMITNMSERV